MSFYLSRFPRSFWKIKNESKILSSFTNGEGSKEMEFRELVFDSTFKGLKSFIRKSTKLIEIDIDPNYFQVFETMPIQNQVEIKKKMEPRNDADMMRQFAYEQELTPLEKEKIPFNFGKCALGTYLRNQIKKGFYDEFLQKTLNMNAIFIKLFKDFCKTVEYGNINHFRKVWRYTEFTSDIENNKFVALRNITSEFLKKDVNKWINKKTKKESYKPYYRRCADFYLQWIEDVDALNCSDFCKFLWIYN